MSDSPDKRRIDALDDRLETLRMGNAPKPREESHYSQAQAGWRMVTELVTGLLLGFGIGYGLDVLFGTLPVLMIIFTMLGFIAGVRTMMRTAQEIQDKKMQSDAPVAPAGKDEMYDDD
ncbi:UNVERIFIED_CONTAM: hypothetical protein GTU68_058707 [Idotea baltica]|nr:hypothetical protein [Idotea baltica]